MNDEKNQPTSGPGARLRRLRKARGLTIIQLADRIDGGIHFTTISKLERGTMALSYDWADKIAKALGTTPLEILESNYEERDFKSVPLYFFYSWDPSAGINGAKQLGWVPTTSGGPNAFALGFYPSKEMSALAEIGMNSVIDPDQRVLHEWGLYAIYTDKLGVPMLAIFQLNPPRFVDSEIGTEIVLGEDHAVVLGRVIFQCRSLPSN